MIGNTYMFVVQRQTTPAQYQVVEFDNTDLAFTLIQARDEVNTSLINNYPEDWKVLCSASGVDDAHEIINRAIDVDEMLIGNLN